jgi:DNA-directed RNA polymerase subunit RPC12/RpoP
MAQLYTIKCPKCGRVFNVLKGVTMSWDFSRPIPKNLQEDTPFNCPDCNHQMCVNDKIFQDCVVVIMHLD